MLAQIKRLISGVNVKEDQVSSSHDRIESAAAALLIEMALMDGKFDAEERTIILELLASRFGIDREDAAVLIAESEVVVENAIDLFSFTRVFRDNYEEEERLEIIEMLWEVAYADGILHDFEANLVRRANGLLNINDRDSGEARKRVLERLNI